MKNTIIDLAAVRKFENMEFLAKQLVEGFITGLHQSPYHGFSVEFSEHRLYNSGESTRHIDWKVFARTDKLFVKRYEEETNLRCHLLLDVSPSMFYPVETYGKVTFSALCAAAIANMLQRQRDAVGLVTFSNKVDVQTPVRSTTSHVHTLMLQLQKLISNPAPGKDTDVAGVIHQIAQQIQRRSLVIILSDMLSRNEDASALLAALQHLKHRNHEVLLFHVTDKSTEEEFNFPDRPYVFVDIETGEEIKLQPSQVRTQYLQAMNQFKQELALKCGQYKIDFIPVDIQEPFEKVLMSYLIKRSKIK
ncbi:MAG: DUF58 domain-containing protein [Adhaeribacter sp.]